MRIDIAENLLEAKTEEVMVLPVGTTADGSSRWVKTDMDTAKPWLGPRNQRLADIGIAFRVLKGELTICEGTQDDED